MTKVKVNATGVWKSFLLSFLFPIIGGLIVYFRNKKRNKELANICLILSILHPMIAGFFIGFGIGYTLSYLGLVQLETVESYSIVLGFPVTLVLTILLMKAFEENKYKYFIPVWYFALIGAIYSYYYAYKKNKPLQKDVGWFFLGQLLASLVITPLIDGILSYWTSMYVGEQVKSFEVIANETIALEPEYYYYISFYSPAGTNELEVNLESPEGIRFILLRPLDCVRFEDGEEYYSFEQKDVKALESTYELTEEGDWCLILWNILPYNVSTSIEVTIWYENLP